jgi:hypothetical protein
MTLRAAPTDLADIEIQADLEGAEPHAIVNVKMVAEIDQASLEDAAERVRRFVRPDLADGAADA